MSFTHWYAKDDDHKWHEFVIMNTYTTNEYFRVYEEVVAWIEDNIDNPTRHARWNILADRIQIKFRHERDYLLCMLRWS